LVAFLGGMMARPTFAEAQGPDRVWRIGFLDGGQMLARRPMFDVFRQRMAELGYIEGRNVVYEARAAEGKFDSLPKLVSELLGINPDALLVGTTPAGLAAKAATSAVPIIIVAVADPVGVGLVDNLARPGGNITGITNIVAELTGKRLEILKALVPGASRIAVLANPGDPVAAVQLKAAEIAASELGIELRPVVHVRAAEELNRAFVQAVAEHADAAIRLVDPLSTALAKPTAQAAAEHRLPVIYPFRENVVAGGLASYGTDLPSQFGQAATLMDKVLQGAKPADLPVQQPTRFELVINLKTAKALGITVPQSLLARADEVIE
jgi:putative ABC transport system substrate-binding protein